MSFGSSKTSAKLQLDVPVEQKACCTNSSSSVFTPKYSIYYYKLIKFTYIKKYF